MSEGQRDRGEKKDIDSSYSNCPVEKENKRIEKWNAIKSFKYPVANTHIIKSFYF